jgi:hypothetical protein
MPELTNLPLKTKYTPGDSVYILQEFQIIPVTIAAWRVKVSNPLNNTEGLQETFYSFENKGKLEIVENLVFASENSVLAYMKNDWINRAIESGTGGYEFFRSGLNSVGDERSFGNWTDFAGFDLTLSKFIITGEKVVIPGTATVSGTNVVGTGTSFLTHYAPGDEFDLTGGTEPYEINKFVVSIADDTHMIINGAPGVFTDQFPMKIADPYEIPLLIESEGDETLVFDYCRLGGATLPAAITSKEDFRAAVKSYDAVTTIWTDDQPIGRP